MEKIAIENLRLVLTAMVSTIFAIVLPTKGFLVGLIIMFGFNIWAGMRADGVAIKRCQNYSHSKFKDACFELLWYIVIIQIANVVMRSIGDGNSSYIVMKTLTCIFIYVYAQNAFKNLIQSYPTNKSYRIIYHLIRLEFMRAMPSHVQDIIDRIDRETDEKTTSNT